MSAASAPLPTSLPPYAPQLMKNHPPWPQTHYTVLGLPPDCAQNDIRQRYFDLSRKHHPDMGGSVGSFIPLRSECSAGRQLDGSLRQLTNTDAYSVLGDPAQRKDYDTYLRHLAATVAFAPFTSPLPFTDLPQHVSIYSSHPSSEYSRGTSADWRDEPWASASPSGSAGVGSRRTHRSTRSPARSPDRTPHESRHYVKAHSTMPQPLPQRSGPDYRYLFEEEAGRIRRWVEKVVDANDRRARRYEGCRRFRRHQREAREVPRITLVPHDERSEWNDRSGPSNGRGDWETSMTYAEPEERRPGKASTYATARSRTLQSEPEPTWTELLSFASHDTVSSSSSSDSTSLPSHSSQSTYRAPHSALRDEASVTPSMSPTQPPRRKPRRTPFPSPAPGTPSGASSTLSAVRETLRQHAAQHGETPITRMLVAELDKLEARQVNAAYPYTRPGFGYAEHYAGQVGQRRAGRLKILLLVLRTLVWDSVRRWFRVERD